MKERYTIIKELYPNYLIYIKKNNKYILYNKDKLIYKYFHTYIDNLNYLKLNNLDIESLYNIDTNNIYDILLVKSILIDTLERCMYEKNNHNS